MAHFDEPCPLAGARPSHDKERCVSKLKTLIAAFVCAAPFVGAAMISPVAHAQDKVVAKVNGKDITEADLRLAEAEIGNDLGSLPPASRRRVLVEYVIENQLFADAAEAAKLATGPGFDERMQYWRRRALREYYFDKQLKSAVTEADAKKIYDTQVQAAKPQEEVRARHILVDSEAKAKDLLDKITKGGDFVALAKEHSQDPGSKGEGGDLGYFSRGQMVPVFEEAAFRLKAGEVSEIVRSQFGWHILKVEDRRTKGAPPFDSIKERLIASMIHRKAQEAAAELRGKAKLEYIDPDIKAQVDRETGIRPAPPAGGITPVPAPK